MWGGHLTHFKPDVSFRKESRHLIYSQMTGFCVKYKLWIKTLVVYQPEVVGFSIEKPSFIIFVMLR